MAGRFTAQLALVVSSIYVLSFTSTSIPIFGIRTIYFDRQHATDVVGTDLSRPVSNQPPTRT